MRGYGEEELERSKRFFRGRKGGAATEVVVNWSNMRGVPYSSLLSRQMAALWSSQERVTPSI